MARFRRRERTVDGKIAQRGTRCPLYFNVGVFEEEENGPKGIAVDCPDI